MASDAPAPDPPRLLSGGHVLRTVGELVASLVPALAAAPWLVGQAAPRGRLPVAGCLFSRDRC
jgi:hypothetical protein